MENNNDAFDFNSWANNILNEGENKSNNFSVDALLNDATKLPVSYYGAYNTSDYKKYLGSSAVEEVGINPGWSNRDFEVKFDEAQPYTEAIANTISKFADITKDATVNYFKSYYTGADDLIAYNQKKAQEDSDKGYSDPTFTSSNKSGLGTVFSTDFYENLFPSLGYVVGTMGSAVVENIAIDLLTGGFGAGAELLNSGRKVKNTINYLLNVDKVKGALKAEQALTGMQKFKAGAQMYNMINGVRSEAAMEGGNNAFETLQSQKKAFKDKYGYEPFGDDLARMEEYAKSAGKADYLANLPILMASNLVQFADLLLPEVVAASESLKDSWKGYNLVNKGTTLAPQLELEQQTFSDLWKTAKGIDKVKAVAQYTSEIPAFKYLTSAGSEGMEESLQKLASTSTQDYYTNKSKGKEGIWDSTKHGLGEMLSDEGVQEFLGGFMIGSLSHARHGITSVVNKTQDLFTKKEDRPVRLSEKDIEFNKMKDKVSYLNDTSLDKVLKSDGIKDAFVNGQLSREIKAFSKTGDIFNLKNSQDHALLNYLWAGYKTGKLDYRLNELEKIANLDYSKEEMASMLGVSVNELNDKRGSQAVRNIIDKVQANKVNFQAVEDYFENNSNVGELREQYNNDITEFKKLVDDYSTKYKATDFNDTVSKLSPKEATDLLIRQMKLEESKANLIAYNEGVKVASFAYASLQTDKKRQAGIFNTLANNSKLDYTSARELMNVRVAEEKAKQLKEAIKTAKAINDPEVKNYEKQLELVENIIEEHGKDQFMSPDKMAKLLQDFAHESLPAAERITIRKDAKMMDDLNPLSDAVKLEKKNRRNVELYDYLMDIKNFNNHNRKISKDIMNFRRKTIDWFAELQEQQNKPKAETTTTTTTTETKTPENAKFKKGDRVLYEGAVYGILDIVDTGNGKFAYSLVDSTGEPLLDEKDLKVYVQESELEALATPPAPAPNPASGPILTGEEKKKDDAINLFIANNPSYKKEEIEFVTETDANGKTTNKVISKNPMNKGEDLSSKPEFKNLIKELDDTQEQRDEEKRKEEELKAKIKEFNSEKVKYINGKKTFTKEEKRNLILDVKDFMEANGLDPKKVTGTLKELVQAINSITPIEEKDDVVDNDYVPGDFPEGAPIATSPFKTVVQEEETVTLPNGERQNTGKILDEHLIGTYNHFVQSSLANPNFLDGFYADEDGQAMYYLTMVKDGEQYDYERSKEFQEQMKKGTANFGVIILVTDAEGNPIRFNDDHSISSSPTEGRIIRYPFTFVGTSRTGDLYNPSFNVNQAVGILARQLEKQGYDAAEAMVMAQEEITNKLEILKYLREYLLANPEEKVNIDFSHVSRGVILGNQVKNNSSEFLKDEDFELEIVKDENAEGGEQVNFRNSTATNGSLVAIVNVDGSEVVLRVNPNEISDDIRQQINTILAHDFTLPDGSVDKNINKVREYLDALIYTKKGARQFIIKGNKIVYSQAGEEFESLPEQPFLLNVYSKNLNERSEKPKFKKDGDKLVLDTNDKGALFTTWDYNKFILDNSFIRGVKSEGKIREVNRYINFDVPTSTLEETGYIDLSEEGSGSESTSTEIEKNKKADLEQLKAISPSNYIRVKGDSKDLLKKFREYLTDVLGWGKMVIGYSNGNLTLDYLGTELKIPASINILGGDTAILDINVEDVIEAKYDAELKALEGTQTTQPTQTGPTKEDVLDLQKLVENETGFRSSTYFSAVAPVLKPELKNKYPELYKELYDLHLDMVKQIMQSMDDRRDAKKEYLSKGILEQAKIANSFMEIMSSLPEVKAVFDKLKDRFYDVANRYEKASTQTQSTSKLNNEVLETDPDLQADKKENPSDIIEEGQNALDQLMNDDNEYDAPFRKKEILNEVATQLMKNSEWEYLIKFVGKDNIINLFNVANSDAWAKWTTAGITLWKNPKRGTGYHEAWHHFSQLYLTKKQKKALYNEVRNKVSELKDATDLQVEEYLADDFMNYMLSGGKKSEFLDKYPVRKNIFQKIWDTLKALFGGTRPVNLNKLYNDLRLGNLYNYKSSIDNAMFGKLERAIYDETGTKEIMPSEKVHTYVGTADVYIGQILTERNSKYKGMRLVDLYSLDSLLEDSGKLSLIYDILRQKFATEASEENNNGLSKKVKADFAKLVERSTWEKFVKEHLRANKVGISEDSDIEIDEVSGEKSQEFSEKIHDKASNLEDLFKTAPQEIKKLLSFIQKKKAVIVNGRITTEDVHDSFGLPILCEQRNLFDRLCVELNGMTRIEEMIQKLNQPETLIRIPEALNILEFLPANPGNDLGKLNLLSTFLQAFTNPYVQAVQGVINKNGEFSLQEATRLGEDELKRTYLDNFNAMRKNSNFVKEGIVAADENGINYITPNVESLDFNFAYKGEVTKFLSLLGIKFDSNVFADTALFNEFKRSVTTADLTRLLANIKHRAAWNIPSLTSNPVNELVKKVEIEDPEKEGEYIKFPSNFSVIKNILAFANKYNYSDPNASFINAKGERVFGFQKHNGFTQRIAVINKVNSAKELRNTPGFENFDFEKNPHMRGSEWANLLFDFSKPDGPKRIDKRTGEKVKLNILNYDGFQSNKANDSFKKTTADLSPREKFRFDMLSFLSNGVIDIPRTESASSFFSIAPSTYSPNSQNFSPLMISIEQVLMADDIFSQPIFMERVEKYLEAEMYKIKNGEEIYGKDLSKEKDKNGVSEFDKVVTFTLFDDILSDELKKKLKEEIKKNDNLTEIIANNEEAIRADVSNYFNEYKENIESLFDEYRISEKDISPSMIVKEKEKLNSERVSRKRDLKKQYRDNKEALEIELKALDEEIKARKKQVFDQLKSNMSAAFVANHFIQSVEFLKFFEADLGYYKDYFKRSKGMNATGAPALFNTQINDFLANTPSMASALGISYSPNDFNLMKTFALKDDERPSISNNSQFKNKKVGTKKVTQMVHDTLMSIYLAEKALNPKAKFSFTNKQIEEVEKQLERYEKKANGADGQGYCTLDFYRFIKNRFGNWSKEEEALYQAEVLKFKLHEGVFKTKEEKDAANKLIRSKIKEAKGFTFPVVKVSYRGVAKNKAFTPVMDKFSLAPLLIDSIKGTSLESMNKKMLENKVGYGKFKSGTKLWAPKLNDLFQNGQFSFVDDSVVEQYPDFIREQIKSDPSTKNKVTVSTQSRALIFADLYQNGIPNDYNGSLDQWNKLTPEEKAKASWVESTRQRYLQNINDIIEYHKEKLYEEIGVTKDGNRFIINDQEKLINLVQKEIIKRGLNKNVEEYIVYDKVTGKNILPLDYAPNRIGIGDIILNIVDKEVRRIKINGSQLIQIAGTGFQKVGKETNFKKPTTEQLETYGTNGLNFYYLAKDKKGNWYTEPMGIKVSLSGDFKNLLNLIHPDGKRIGTRERLNEIIAADENRPAAYQKWINDHKKQLTVVGCRIPVGDTNFHDVMLVKEFLPEEQGDVIVLPHESTVKSGTDYDIDKMTFYRPVINADGTLAKKYNKTEKKKKEDELSKLEQELSKERAKVKSSTQSVLEMFENVSDIGDKKRATYKAIKELNSKLDNLYNEETALIRDRKNKTSDKQLRLGEIFYETQLLENRLNNALQSMTELSVLQNDYFESRNKVKELSNQIKIITNNLDDINDYTNEMIDIYSNILTNPTVFKKLITPSANEDFNKAADKVGEALPNRKVKEYKNTRVLEYMSSLDKFRELIGTKRLLGAFAKNNKYGPLFQMAGLGFNTSIFAGYYGDNGQPVYKAVRTLLMDKKQEDESRKNGYISLGLRYSFDGKNLQDLKSQGIVSTVDIASDPTFSQFGVNDENVGMFLLLLNLGIDLDMIGAFINQPVILAYTTAIVTEGVNRNDARREIDEKLKKLIKKKGGKVTDTSLANINSQIKNRFEYDEIKKNLGKSASEMTLEELVRQRELFSHYFHMAELENGIRTLQSVTSWDTSKLDSPISAHENIEGVRELRNSGLFNEEGLNKMLDHSFISNFNVSDLILSTFQRLFPVTNNNLVYSKLLENINSIKDFSKKIAARRIIVNDFVEAIVKTFGEYKGMNFSEYADALQYFSSDPEVDNSKIVVDRLNDFKEDPANEKIIKQFPIIDKLLSNVNIDTRQLTSEKSKNIEIYRLMDTTTEDQNSYIDQLKKLINHPDEKVADLFKDVSILAFNQSGFNKSFLSFFDIIPFEFFQPIFAIAESNYNNLTEQEEEDFIDGFSNESIYENPQLFTAEYDENENTSSNLYYFRGKKYLISIEEQEQGRLREKEKGDDYDKLLELAELNKGRTIELELKNDKFKATFTGELQMVKPAEYITLSDGKRKLRSPAVHQLQLMKDDGQLISLTKKTLGSDLITDPAKVEKEVVTPVKVEKTTPIVQPTNTSTKQVRGGSAVAAPTVFEKTNVNTSYSQEVQDIIAASKLSEGEYKVVKVNGNEVVISIKDLPATMKEGNEVFYTKAPSGLLIQRYGKRFIVPGYEDIVILEDQVNKNFFEKTTGMNIPINEEDNDKAREEMKNKFDKHNIRDILSSRVKIEIDLPGAQITSPSVVVPQPTQQSSVKNFDKKNIFSVIPQQGAVDYKAAIKASISTQYIGFGEGIKDSKGNKSSTEIYREQAGKFANTGKYSSNDIIFVSIPGKRGGRGGEVVRKEQQDKTIKEAIKAVEAGATILTDNKAYIESSDYNEGEKRLYKNMEAKGYNYSEITIDGQVIGTWSKLSQEQAPTKELTVSPGAYVKYNGNTYIVTKVSDNKMVQLYDPRREGATSKIQVSIKTLLSKDNKILPNVAKIVYFDKTGHNYIVTEKGTIISLQTNTKMNWDENNGNRKAILKLAEESDGISQVGESTGVNEEEVPAIDPKPLTFRTLDTFDDDAKVRILTNFAKKYRMTEEKAEAYIDKRLAEGKKDSVIENLKTCNFIF